MIELNKKLELIDSIEVFYLINNSIATYNHVFKVAEISKNLSKKYNLDSEKCYLSGLIHDISTHLSPIEMLFYAEKHNWLINDIEREYPSLLHQKISSNLATELFDIYDKDILNAINCHTTLKSNPDIYDMVLFIADKLSWGEETIFFKEVNLDLEISLECACLKYINLSLDNKLILKPHPDLLEAKEYFESIIR